MSDTSMAGAPLSEAVIQKRITSLDDEIRLRLVQYPHATFPAGLFPTLVDLTQRVAPDPAEATGAGEERFELRQEVQDYLTRTQQAEPDSA